MLVDEAVGAGGARHVAGEAQLVDGRARGGAEEGPGLVQAGDAPLLQAARQGDEHVARGLGVGEGPVAGGHRGAEGFGDGAEAVVGQPGRQQPGQGKRVDGALAQPAALEPLQFVVEEPHVERGVVGHDDRALEELEQVGDRPARCGARRPPSPG